jgi:hypothetical protein
VSTTAAVVIAYYWNSDPRRRTGRAGTSPGACGSEQVKIALEDGDGKVVYRLRPGKDDFEVLAFYVTFRPLAPR